MQLTENNVQFADDGIRTVDLWCRKQPLCQLRHNHCPLLDVKNEWFGVGF